MTLRNPLLGLSLAASLLCAALPSQAAIGTLDNVPSATLLLPYFEVDPVAADGQRTLVTLGNASPAETLAHVTLWTDRGVPTHSFDVRLPGYGVSEIDLRALFADGTVPASTAGGFATCAATLPAAALSPAQITGLRNAHTGQASSLLGNQCGGVDHGDGHARGYMTVDVVNACTTLVPGSPGYFVDGGLGIATNSNVLWGEQATVIPSQGVAYGDVLVHIEASATDINTNGVEDAEQFFAADYTFYGRLVAAAADNREGLPMTWMGRYSLEGAILGTTAQIWRDPGAVGAFACGTPPPPLTSGTVVAFDHQEQVSIDARAMRPQYATQTVDLDDPSQSAVPFASGFISYHLGEAGDATFESRNQAFVSHVYRSSFGGSGQASVWPGEPIANSAQGAGGFTFGECADGIDNDGDGNIDFPADGGCQTAEAPAEAPQCSNGIDDDGDGDIDYPADNSCRGPFSIAETTECSDGIDNFDADLLVDMLDPGCATPIDLNEDENACSDGIDNDGDGLIDFSPGTDGDPSCAHPFYPLEANVCDDGIDNDGDGQTDFPDDLGCFNRFDNDEVNPACNDGIDNDGDGQTDFPDDLGCFSLNDGNEVNPVCSDGLDNDGDGDIDFPADPGCFSGTDSDEVNGACDDGVDNDGDGDIDFPADTGCFDILDFDETNTACDDGVDNDGDGNTDFPADTGCESARSPTESPQCGDGIDNDGDGDTDFPADSSCASATSPFEETECSDGFDNDFDGNTDFPADTVCTAASDDTEAGPPPGGNGPSQCNDGIDNDGDGLTDFPLSPGCTNPFDTIEGPDCSDLDFDNDRDGTADAADPGCESPADWNELSNATTRACSDGIDNDGDGLTDYPADTGCMSAWDDVEFSPASGAPLIDLQPVALPDGNGGVAYNQLITASGGTGPYSFLVVSGTLPAGLTLAADGTLDGTPTEAGSFPLTVEATDSNAFTGSRDYTLLVVAPVIDLAPLTLPDGDAGVAYSQAISASGGAAPYTFAVTTGVLPNGLSLAADGTLDGTPTVAGSFAITIEATDNFGFTGTRDYNLTVNPSLIDVQPASLPDGDGGVPYSQTITASGGTAPYTFALAAGALPGGLTLAADGTLDGTPTQAGSFDFTVEATDANAFTGARAYTLVVTGPVITLAPATLPDAETGTPYNQAITASGGAAPYTFSAGPVVKLGTGGTVKGGVLPPGLSLAADGTLSGTPTSAGTFEFSIEALDDNGFSGEQAYSLVVAQGTVIQPEPTVIPTTAPWSLLLLFSLLGFGALLALRRR